MHITSSKSFAFLFASLLAIMVISVSFNFDYASAHIFPDTPGAEFQQYGKYTVAFLPVPDYIEPNKTAILNLNIQENGTDARAVVASVEIKENETGEVVDEFPTQLYNVADIFFPHKFDKAGDYVVNLTANINGDPQYDKVPIIANFGVTVRNPVDVTLIIIQSVIVVSVILGLLVIVRYLGKQATRQSKSS